MATRQSPTLSLRASGPLALFTDPALKVERMSYPVMTPSAARGVLEAVLWKPAIRWQVQRIRVLSPIRFTSFRRNEVNSRAVVPSTSVVDGGGELTPYFADDDRAQRNTVALRCVDYVIEATFSLTEHAGPDDNILKFAEMFRRRVEKGQQFHQPYLGCREFAADVRPAEHAPEPIPETRDLGWMLWDIAYGGEEPRPLFFNARLDRGIVQVPPHPLGAQPMEA